MDEVDVVSPTGKTVDGLVHIRTCSFDDEGAVLTEDVVELWEVEEWIVSYRYVEHGDEYIMGQAVDARSRRK